MKTKHKIGTAVASIAVVAGLTGLGYASDAGTLSKTQIGREVPSEVWNGSASGALNRLWVAEKNQAVPYVRVADFGEPWVDVDKNDCDTRNDILKRDLNGIKFRGPCVVDQGWLADPYTNKVIRFLRGVGTSDDVQIDHVVALSDAWRSGAWEWSFDERLKVANDPLNLIATDGPTNASKGDSDAAEWLPPNKAFQCSYVARQVAVKLKYNLSVTLAEKKAMQGVLDTCPLKPLPAPADASVVKPAA